MSIGKGCGDLQDPEYVTSRLLNFDDDLSSEEKKNLKGLAKMNNPRFWQWYHSEFWWTWNELKSGAYEKLEMAISSAQNFVQEDLSFLLDLACDHTHCASTDTLMNGSQFRKDQSQTIITQQQQDILRGNITKTLNTTGDSTSEKPLK